MNGEYGRIGGEEEGDVGYGGMMQPSQQHVAACVKEVKWGLNTRGLRMMATSSAGIPVEDTQEAVVVPHCRRALKFKQFNFFIVCLTNS